MKINQRNVLNNTQNTCLKIDLLSYISEIDNATKNNRQLVFMSGMGSDVKFMEPLIELANSRKENLNAFYADSPMKMVEQLKTLIKNNVKSARFIVRTGLDCIHLAAFDYFMKDNQSSIIGIEPANIKAPGSALLASRIRDIFKRELPEISLAIIESDLQRSSGECGIFSLFLVKKILKEHDHFKILHHRNVKNDLPVNDNRLITLKNANGLLPPSFLKHAQSPKRVKNYLAARADLPIEAKEKLINNFSENITKIYQGNKSITYNNSIEIKRKVEMERLLENLK